MMPSRTDLFAAYALPDRVTPRIRMNFVASADGAATLGGRSGALGGPGDRALMQVLRTMADVVLVGAGTVRAEGYGGLRVDAEDVLWRRARGLPDQPALAIVSGSLRLQPDDAVFADAVRRPVVFTTDRAAAERGDGLSDVADIVTCGGSTLDLSAMRTALVARGWAQVLCEGGPRLYGALLDEGFVDEVCLTISPRFVGGAAGRIAQGAGEEDRVFALAGILHDADGFVFAHYRRELAGGVRG